MEVVIKNDFSRQAIMNFLGHLTWIMLLWTGETLAVRLFSVSVLAFDDVILLLENNRMKTSFIVNFVRNLLTSTNFELYDGILF